VETRTKIIVTLPRELASRLEELAARAGRPVSELSADLLERSLSIAEIATPSESKRVYQDNRETNGVSSSARPKRYHLTPEESLRRMKDFKNRKDEFIASIRKSKG
jgi:hypothetical protein